jgi:CO/xanthine dehydrogenase Mo-binding subunit
MSSIGIDIPRVDGPAKVTGGAQYTANIELPQMVYAKALRSIHPHARIIHLDSSKAERLPGVVAVLTREDLTGINPYFGPMVKDQPIVAIDRVRYVGDIVVAVAAEERDIAEEALSLIDIEYDPMPAVFDSLEAMQPGAPILHPGRRLGKTESTLMTNENVVSVFHIDEGDLATGFKEADEIFEDVYTTPKVQHGHIEPHVATAFWEPSGKLVVYSATQNPSMIRVHLGEMFGIPQTRVRVIVPFVGGGFGGKVHLRVEPICAALARKARRPVQWVLTREEVFLTGHCQASVVKIRTGVKRDGALVAREVKVVYDTGAYALTGPTVASNGGQTCSGPYRIPHQSLTSYCVYTNSPPTGPYRGFGHPQVCWAYESQMDDIARRLQMDPLELRLKNLVQEGDVFVTGDKLTSIGIADCLKEAAEAINWEGKVEQAPRELTGKVFGKGIACMIKTVMPSSNSAAIVRLNADGSAVLLTSSVEIGQGTHTSLAQIVAEEIGLPADLVSVTFPDTDMTPFDRSTSSSITIFNMGNAALRAARQVREQLLEIGAKAMEARIEDLELSEGFVRVKGMPKRQLDISQLFRAHFGAPIGSLFGSFDFQTTAETDPITGKGKTTAFLSFSACAAEVEVDIETGKIQVHRIITSVDAGKAINPRQCHLQNEGSMMMSLGSTLFEEMVFDNGQPINATFLEYMLPSIKDHPRQFKSLLVETPHPDGPFGAKGVGETAVGPVEPAIGNAVANALGGIRIRDLPLRPDKVLAVLETKLWGKK